MCGGVLLAAAQRQITLGSDSVNRRLLFLTSTGVGVDGK